MAPPIHSTSPGTTIDTFPIPELRAAVRGQVITPEDAADVSRVVTFARDREIPLSVRSGGHGMAGHGVSDGGITLDLARMKALEIDVTGRTAWAETGLTAGEYTQKAGALGLATGLVGIGGITLGGGIAYFVRKHGLTIHDLLAAEIVTADGELRHVDETNHPDLFWAIRGGGGNFGVATRFRFRLHEVDTVVSGMLMLPAMPDTIAAFVAESQAAPEALSSIAMVMKAPPMPFVPEAVRGTPIIMALMCYAGDVAPGERAIAPFRAIAAPLVDTIGAKLYPEMYPPEDDRHPLATTHTMFTDHIDRNVAGTILDRIEASTAMMAAVQIRVLGGAMARVPADATAFAHRNAKIMAGVAAIYGHPDQKAEHERWVTATAGALRQGNDGAYVNFLTDEGEDRVRAAYPGATWERLAAIKARYDRTNLFRLNQNIPPAEAEAASDQDGSRAA